ncbi:MAG: argonaute/piwi family protein [Bdellovibrionota bacterium]
MGTKKTSQYEAIERNLRRNRGQFRTWFVAEPKLEFGGGNLSVDPKTGIATFGPWGSDGEAAQKQIRLGIIGTGETISAAVNWLDRCRTEVVPGDPDVDSILFPAFPGLEDEKGFNCRLDFPQRLQEILTPAEVARCSAAPNRDTAVNVMGSIIKARLEALAEKDSPPDVVLIALPEEVRKAAGGGRSPARKQKTKKVKETQQLTFLDLPPPEQQPIQVSRTLHRVIKAEGMRAGLPTQLAWPSTFLGGDVQDDATRAWNFCTALYYKAGGVPWRVTGLAKDTCYIGITFYKPLNNPSQLQTSMAQAFSDRGDGIILRGESFEWDSRTQGEPHLSQESAYRLIASVIEQYSKHLRRAPARVVVHKSSSFSPDELKGMREALGNIPYHDFLSVGRSNVRFLRMGEEPPLRGTVIEIAPKRYVMYTGGYVPFFRVYPGLRIPSPLLVNHQCGSGAITDILQETLALTKLNWNAASFATANPITVDFSNNVGLILSELPEEVQPRPHYRFYM